MNTPRPHRILIVDDEEDIQFVVSHLLGFNDYEVTLAPNGKERLTIARQTKPDLIVSDVTMPIMGGFEMLKALRADEQLRHIPVVFHSVLVEPRYEKQAKELGSVAFLKKPCSGNEMLAAIQECLRGRQ